MSGILCVLGSALAAATVWVGPVIAAPADHAPAIAVALDDQPLPADQLAMGLRLARALDLDETIQMRLDEPYARLRAAARRRTADTPPDFRKRFLAVSDRVVDDQERQDLDAIMAGMARYYVASLSPGDLAEITAFYEHPVVAANIREPDELLKHADELKDVMPSSEQMAAFDEVSGAGVEVGRALLERRIGTIPERLTPRMCAALTSQKLVTECPG
jgi:hypothetical protein